MSSRGERKPPAESAPKSHRVPQPSDEDRNIYLRLTAAVQLLLAIGLTIFFIRRDWENVFLTITVILLTVCPAYLARYYKIILPPEFQFIAAAFVFLSLFLGSATDFYYKYPWWDVVLHTSSGFLLGIIGFLALFLINHTDHLPQGIKPSFLCLFAVTFAVTLGVLWEIFEFVVDRFTAANMQSTETGVVDTMKDLIVDTIGAVVVALMGWRYLRRGEYSSIANSIRSFMARNPRLFKHSRSHKKAD